MTSWTRSQQIIAITIVWALLLVAVDRIFDKHVATTTGLNEGTPHVELTLTHLCCTGCNDTVFTTLASFPWLGKPALLAGAVPQLPSQVAANPSGIYSGGVTAAITTGTIEEANFEQVDRAIASAGLVVQEMRLYGVPHVELDAHLPHLCCDGCVGALNDTFLPKDKHIVMPGLEQVQVNKAGQLLSLDFVPTDQIASKSIDVEHLIRLLYQAGFVADTIHVHLLQ